MIARMPGSSIEKRPSVSALVAEMHVVAVVIFSGLEGPTGKNHERGIGDRLTVGIDYSTHKVASHCPAYPQSMNVAS